MKYEVWTKRALLVWVPVGLMLGLLPPIAAASALLGGYDPPWPFVVTCALMPAITLGIVWRRHDLHARIRDSIDRYIFGGTRLVIDVPYMSQEEIDAVTTGLAVAVAQVDASFARRGKGSVLRAAQGSMDKAFVIIRSEVFSHRAGKKVRVGGLTYFGGPMVLEYTSDLALLKDRARHEGCHKLLNALGIPDYTGDDHHRAYPELFA